MYLRQEIRPSIAFKKCWFQNKNVNRSIFYIIINDSISFRILLIFGRSLMIRSDNSIHLHMCIPLIRCSWIMMAHDFRKPLFISWRGLLSFIFTMIRRGMKICPVRRVFLRYSKNCGKVILPIIFFLFAHVWLVTTIEI